MIIQDGMPIVLLRQKHLQVAEEGIQTQIKKIQIREQKVIRQLKKKMDKHGKKMKLST